MPKLPDSGFDAVAPVYDGLARLVFGQALQKAQLAALPFVPPGARVLVLGGGSGWILEQLLTQTRCRQILYLEASEKMLQLTARKLNAMQSQGTAVELRPGTESSLHPGETFDVIITNFILDLFEMPRILHLADKLEKSLRPGGYWLVSDFRHHPGRPYWQRALLRAMYLFFRITCRIEARKLPDWNKALLSLKLTRIKSWLFYNQMIVSAVYQKQPASQKV